MPWRPPRWRLPRRARRMLLRWRALRIPADADWRVFQPPAWLSYLPEEQQRRAIETACRMAGVERAGETRSGIMRRTLGVPVRTADGAASWLKITPLREAYHPWGLQGERDVRAVGGIPTPALLRELEWTADGVSWHAFQFALVPSPAIQPTPWISGPMPPLHDDWFGSLKQALDRLSAAPLGRWHVHPGLVARVVAQRFGRKAPYDIDEWRMAHGDLNWSNLTAPEFSMIDWELVGVAPRGFDAAMLLSLSVGDAGIYRRIETTFAKDLQTPSGLVARLYTLARRLNRIEGGLHDPREYLPTEREAKRLLRL